MSIRRFLHLALWILTFELVTIWVGRGYIIEPKCNPLILSTCEP